MTTVTESSVTSIIFTGMNYNSANSDCTFTIAPSLEGALYVDLVIEYLPVFQGDMYIYDSQGNSIVSASQLSTGWVAPLRIYNFPITFVWDGTSDNFSNFYIRLGYNAIRYNPNTKGFPPRPSIRFEPPYNTMMGNVKNDTDAVVFMHQAQAKIVSPSITLDDKEMLNPYLKYQYVISAEPSDSKRLVMPPILTCTALDLPHHGDNITVYDGPSDTSPVIAVLKGTECPSEWISGTTSTMTLVLQTSETSHEGSYELSYFADGEAPRCSNNAPLEFEERSGIFSDGTNSLSEMWRTSFCTWMIKPRGAGRGNVTLTFNRIGIKNSATVEVWEGFEEDDAKLLWNCEGCGLVSPPKLESREGGFLIKTRSQNVAGSGDIDSFGFEAEYYTALEDKDDVGSGDRNTHLLMGTLPSFALPKITEGSYEWIVSPTGLGDEAHPGVGGDVEVSVGVSKMSFPCPPGASSPLPTIAMTTTTPAGVSTLSDITCGATEAPKDWISSTSPISVVLDTAGYKIPEHQIEFGFFSRTPHYSCGFPENENPGIFSHRSFGITDGSLWDNKMGENLDCWWKIDPRDSSGLTLVFNDLDVRGGSLEIASESTGSVIWSCEDCTLPPSKISHPSSVLIRFKTGVDNNPNMQFGKGFQMLYYGLGDGGVGGGRETLGAISDARLAPPTVSATSNLSPPLDDYWITVTASTMGIVVSVLEVDLPASGAVSVYTGTPMNPVFVKNLTDSTGDWVVLSETVHFRFRSDSNFVFAAAYSSYYPENSETSTCGLTDVEGSWGVVTHTSGSFLFNDGSEIAPSSGQSCMYYVDPANPDTRTVFLSFSRLEELGGWDMLRVDEFMEGGFNETGIDYVWNINLGVDEAKAPEALRIGRTRGEPCGETPGLRDNSNGLIQQVHSLDIMKTCGFLKRGNSSRVELVGINGGNRAGNVSLDISTIQRYDERNGGAGAMRFYGKKDASGAGDPVCMHNFSLYSSSASANGSSGAGLNDTVPASALCQYKITSERKESKYITLDISAMDMPPGSSVAIYEGTSDLGRPLFMCGPENVYEETWGVYAPRGPIPKRPVFEFPGSVIKYTPFWWTGYEYFSRLVAAEEFCNVIPEKVLTSKCGKMFVRMEHNKTFSVARGWSVEELDNGVFEGVFGWEELKTQTELELNVPWDRCYDDEGWGVKPVEYVQPLWEKVLILIGYALAALVTVGAVGGTYYYFEVWLPNQQIQINKPVKMAKAKKIPHASYTPIWNSVLNKMLKTGECTICFGDEKTFKLPGCKHEVCLDCLRSYIHTALGDASMFPIKCPMHHTGCLTVFEPKFAQRVLNRDEFERFNLFNDRAVYGDGMACIFCGNFVIFPDRMGGVMVACPYCRQRFCMKCKVAWHVGVDCMEEGKDDLEEWRKLHGATRCPGCFKVIEKDDPETCNHMVHKAVDSIPCVQERTDFCYCCGLEVTPDYPHFELMNPGVNHFPDGVYNDCRRGGHTARIIPVDFTAPEHITAEDRLLATTPAAEGTEIELGGMARHRRVHQQRRRTEHRYRPDNEAAQGAGAGGAASRLRRHTPSPERRRNSTMG
ncbi:hypothetical protein TrRE_jg3075 [Triparma retinervis]|uniref:RBR-type E3 ubiquitin transferase n=1 Tax=Triparma retinervis TaxID=2557542 RepID=A0A9W7FEQ3_9STRA|nr:hypothetical protein TrRE_jg3075 [Triparma retinervis]